MVDVAKAAGVSQSTVSRVISGNPAVSPATAERIRKVIKQMGYRGMPRRKSNGPQVPAGQDFVLLVIDDTPGLAQRIGHTNIVTGLMAGGSRAADAVDGRLSVAFVSDPGEVSNVLQESKISGVIFAGVMPRGPLRERLDELGVVGVMNNPVVPDWCDVVQPDTESIGRQAAEHLIEAGCRRPAIVCLQSRHAAIQTRRHAYVDRLEAEGLEVLELLADSEDAALPAHDLPQAMQSLADQLLRRKPAIDGLFVPTDREFARVWPILLSTNAKLAQRLVTVSCDNESTLLPGFPQGHATLDLCADEIGVRAIQQLLWRRQTQTPGPFNRVLIRPRMTYVDHSSPDAV
jgi:LacI family transcriptional regulator